MIKIKFITNVVAEHLPISKRKVVRINELINNIKNCPSTTEKNKLISLLKKEDFRFVPLSVKLSKYQTLILEEVGDTNVWAEKYLEVNETLKKVEESYRIFNNFNFNHTKIEPHI